MIGAQRELHAAVPLADDLLTKPIDGAKIFQNGLTPATRPQASGADRVSVGLARIDRPERAQDAGHLVIENSLRVEIRAGVPPE